MSKNINRSGESYVPKDKFRRMPGLLMRSSVRFLMHHPWLFGFSVIGIALGVAVVISIDLANNSAMRAFELSSEAVTGSATHNVRGASGELDEEVYRDLRTLHGIRKSAPVVEGHATVATDDRTFRILGVDPLAENPFRNFTSQEAGLDIGQLIAGGLTGLISENNAERWGIEEGDTVSVSSGGRDFDFVIAGIITTENERTRRALNDVLVTDIGTAQEILRMHGSLSHIDLILPEDDVEAYERVEEALPGGALLERSETRSESALQMTRAFEYNLQALSLLALLVGMFLIYNTMTFSVVQRRKLVGRLRALGVTSSEILYLIIFEALLLGLLGTLIGIGGGILLANGLLQLVTQSINDLYFVLSVREITVDAASLLKGALLGIGATVFAALWPAREAASASVSTVLRRSEEGSRLRNSLWAISLAGIAFLIGGILLLALPGESIALGYVSLLFIIIGFALLTPLALKFMAMVLKPVFSAVFGLTGRMAVRSVVTELNRSSVAIAALGVAVAATIGVGVMVDSFRNTVDVWLESQLQADIYVQPPGFVASQNDAILDPQLVNELRNADMVEESHTVRNVTVNTEYGSDGLVSVDHQSGGQNRYQIKTEAENFDESFQNEREVMVSEAYAYRNETEVGDSLRILTDNGQIDFRIGAIYYDYTTDQGVISMSREVYQRYFDDQSVSGLALYLSESAGMEQSLVELRGLASGMQEVFIRSNRDLREASMEVFDRTFTVTIVLRILAILVAFVGVVTALMALQLEKGREVAVLRANGMTPFQLWNYMITQTGAMGLKAGILSLPLGLTMAYVLVYVINLRSFGWTLDLIFTPGIFVQALFLSVLAAIPAGLYPAWKMARARPADALRND